MLPLLSSTVHLTTHLTSGPWATLAANDPSTAVDPALIDACGENPGWLCEWAFESTDGNETVAGIVDWVVGRPLAVLTIILIAWLASRLARRYLERAIRKFVAPGTNKARQQLDRIGLPGVSQAPTGTPTADGAVRAARRESRAASIAGVVGGTATVLIWTIALILIFGELGFDLGPFLASAGIAGVALGFGAQSLVKDCISGLFMLMEDQYGIGDVVDLGEAVGVVEEVALRTTVLRGLDGTVWHVPNGEIQRVGNKSQLWSTALVDVDVAYDCDLDEARRVILDTAATVCAAPEHTDVVLEEPELLGVESLGADGITLRLIIKTTPGSQWALQRALREAFKNAFDDAGIEIPFPQRTIWMRRDES